SFSSLSRRPPPPPLFPYTTLFRSRIHDQRRRPQTFIDRGRIDDRLEGRPGLAMRGHRPIVLAAREIVPADHRQDGTGPWIECQRSEEHTSELQSRVDLVCRLLLEK